MLVRCNDRYAVDHARNALNVGTWLVPGCTYSVVAVVSFGGDTRMLVLNEYDDAGWVDAHYLDAVLPGSLWRLSRFWQLSLDVDSALGRSLLLMREELVTIADRLTGGLAVDPADVVVVRGAVRAESARDQLLLHLCRWRDDDMSWLQISDWAGQRLSADPKALLQFRDDQIVMLAELSALDGEPADRALRAQGMLDRL